MVESKLLGQLYTYTPSSGATSGITSRESYTERYLTPISTEDANRILKLTMYRLLWATSALMHLLPPL